MCAMKYICFGEGGKREARDSHQDSVLPIGEIDIEYSTPPRAAGTDGVIRAALGTLLLYIVVVD